MDDVIGKARKVLVRASEILGERGWIQGEFGDQGKGYCMAGAARAAVYDLYGVSDYYKRHEIYSEANGLIALYLGHNHRCPSIARWNDDPARTAEDVILALKKAGTEG
jgi:hypothetical protein